MPNCIVKGCPHKTGQKALYPDVTLHPFPNNINLITTWLLQTGQEFGDLDAMAQWVLKGTKTNNHRICSCHFTDECYIQRGSLKTLKGNAIPTIFQTSSHRNLLSAFGPSAKRKRVADQYAHSTSIFPSVKSVHTQTDDRVFRQHAIMNTEHWVHQKTAHTQTELSLDCHQVTMKTQSGSGYPSAEMWKIHKDHMYPTSFSGLMKTPTCRSSTQVTSYPQKLLTPHLKKSPLVKKTFCVPESPSTASITTVKDPREFVVGPCKASSSAYLSTPLQTTGETNEDMSSHNKDHVVQKKFIVFEECLNALFLLVRCQYSNGQSCNQPIIKIKKTVEGSMLIVSLSCLAGHQSLVWNSQPMYSKFSIGNLLMASSIFFSGSTFQKVQEMYKLFGIPAISHTTYSNYQRSFLFPAIDYHWRMDQEESKKNMRGKEAVLVGDSQFHSPGDCGMLCIYSMMDAFSKKIISFKIEQAVPGKSCAGMETDLFQTCLDDLLANNLDVKLVATGKHVSIRKLMATKYVNIDHRLDVWHLSQSISRKLVALSKNRKCKEIAKWISPINNHLWWCAQTSDGSVDLLVDKWKSILFHIANIHSFHSLKNYKHCLHKKLTKREQERRSWIKATHPAHSTLSGIINDPTLLKDLSKMYQCCHTGSLEVFHSKMSKYHPKRLSFKLDAMYARTCLAALSYNRNVHREQATFICPGKSQLTLGQKQLKPVFSMQNKERGTKPLYEESVDNHLFDIMQDSLKILMGELH